MKWITGCIGVLIICYCAIHLYDTWTKRNRLDQYKAEVDALERSFFNGTIKPLPGPYLQPGNLSDFKFKVIDLGSASSCKLSENGDVLYRLPIKNRVFLNNQSVREWDYFVLTQNNATVSVPGADVVYMKPNGETISISRDSPNSNIYMSLDSRNGKLLRAKAADFGPEFLEGHRGAGTEGFTCFDGFEVGSFGYYDFDLVFHLIQLQDIDSIFVKGSSTVLGDIGTGSLKGKFTDAFSNQLVFFKAGKVTNEVLPIPAGSVDIAVSKNVVALTMKRYPWEAIPFLRTSPGSYKPLPVPKGAVQAKVKTINSHGEYVLDVLDTYAKQYTGLPWLGHVYFVSKDKYIDMDDIAKKFLPQSVGLNGNTVFSLDERGDLLIESKDGTYLLRRK
jgi:hypothetical protein